MTKISKALTILPLIIVLSLSLSLLTSCSEPPKVSMLCNQDLKLEKSGTVCLLNYKSNNYTVSAVGFSKDKFIYSLTQIYLFDSNCNNIKYITDSNIEKLLGEDFDLFVWSIKENNNHYNYGILVPLGEKLPVCRKVKVECEECGK